MQLDVAGAGADGLTDRGELIPEGMYRERQLGR